ncbi:MAG: hypothetical protein Q8L37_04440 [Candidatus Gottesmanbacteria bacterium]|nr:hypothetical protein [Candidatus Gottesmanbacteria bacterium]
MSKAKVITLSKIVDLGAKKIRKFISSDKQLEINYMTISGRHPENPDYFVYEIDVHFMVYILKGSGKIYCDDDVFDVFPGDIIDVPTKVRFATEGKNFEYLTFGYPAWYPEQAFMVDRRGNIIEKTNI